jgi:hypothetical protein
MQAYVKRMQREDGTIPLVAPLDIKALENAFVDVSGESVMWPGERHYMEDVQIEQNHLEAWIEKYKARVVQPVPSVPKGRPGPKPIAKRDQEIRRRLDAGELPDGNKRWAHEIRTACKAAEGARGYSDERIAKVTRRLQEQMTRRSN